MGQPISQRTDSEKEYFVSMKIMWQIRCENEQFQPINIFYKVLNYFKNWMRILLIVLPCRVMLSTAFFLVFF